MLFVKVKVKFWFFEGFIIFLILARLAVFAEFIIDFNADERFVIKLESTIILLITEILPSVLLILSYISFSTNGEQSLDTLGVSIRESVQNENYSTNEAMIEHEDTFVSKSSRGNINRSGAIEKKAFDHSDIVNMIKEVDIIEKKQNEVESSYNRNSKNVEVDSSQLSESMYDERGQDNDSYFQQRVTASFHTKQNTKNSPIKQENDEVFYHSEPETLEIRNNYLKQALNQMISDMGVEKPSASSTSNYFDDSQSSFDMI